MDMRKWLYSYRLGQVRQQLGFVAPLASGEYGEVSQWLPAAALALFKTMSPADQRHSLRVCRGLQAHGCRDKDMLAAALLHDVGKAGGRVPFWTRPVIVLGKMCASRLLSRVVVDPRTGEQSEEAPGRAKRRPLSSLRSTVMGWRRALGYAWWHAEIGAEMAAEAGLSACGALYI